MEPPEFVGAQFIAEIRTVINGSALVCTNDKSFNKKSFSDWCDYSLIEP